MQLICETDAPNWDSWKAWFDEQAEAIANAGLTVLQLWREEGGTTVLVLFQVHNRKNAADWLARQQALGHGMSARFLETTF